MSATAPKLLRVDVAKRPEPRIVSVTLPEDSTFAGWSATAKADFPAGMLADLLSNDIAKIITVLEHILIDHNMPDESGALARRIEDVDPYDGLMTLAAAIFEAIGALPKR